MHWLPWHVVPTGHTFPQLPQLLRSVCVMTHASPQSVVGAGHSHLLALHVAPPVHARPQPPQLRSSSVRFTHAPPHGTFGVEQPLPHVP
jgi:hypothetical protein